ncbi:MAG: hypothetical protein AAF696_19305 [Bacteroidota bacterium]
MKSLTLPILLFVLLSCLNCYAQDNRDAEEVLLFEKVAKSETYQEYYQIQAKREHLMKDNVVFDTSFEYPSKEEMLEAVNETVEFATAMAEIYDKMAAFHKRNPGLKEKEDGFSQLIDFVQKQDADPQVKENVIELIELDQYEKNWKIRILEEFPELDEEKLRAIKRTYYHPPRKD